MLRFRIYLLLVFLLSQINFAQSFTYSGPTSATVLYGNSNVNTTYYFSYQNLSGLYYPCLVVSVDNQVISSDLCNNPSTPSYFTIGFTPGSHTVKFKLLSINGNTLNCHDMLIHQEVEFTVNCYFQISVENIFGGGSINVNGSTISSPARISSYFGSVSIGAIEQDYSNEHWLWNTSGTNNSNWTSESSQGNSSFSSSQNTSYSVQSSDLNTRVVAGLRKVCAATFVKPDGNTSQSVVEGNAASSVTAPSYYVSADWISYSFANWTWDGGSSSSTTIAPTVNNTTTYTANYTGVANPSPMGIQFTSTNGNPISLAWNEHPNNNVTQYQVWRQVTGGSTGAIATLSRGTTSYTDYDYIQNPNGNAKLFYTVKAYYSPSGTWNDPGYILNRGDMGAKIANNDSSEKLKSVNSEVPSEYSISNYPNPFNPTTVISYQLPKDGFVTLKVYDILGKEVAALVNENKQAGYYNATFNASNLPSGMYIYTIQANGFNQSKKMLLVK